MQLDRRALDDPELHRPRCLRKVAASPTLREIRFRAAEQVTPVNARCWVADQSRRGK